MKSLSTTLALLLSVSAIANTTEIVTECTFSSMKNLIIEGLKTEVVRVMKDNVLNPIEISKDDISIVDQGILDFADHDFLGLGSERAFSVSFKTKSGTSMTAFATL
jgi:hypothetical protein